MIAWRPGIAAVMALPDYAWRKQIELMRPLGWSNLVSRNTLSMGNLSAIWGPPCCMSAPSGCYYGTPGHAQRRRGLPAMVLSIDPSGIIAGVTKQAGGLLFAALRGLPGQSMSVVWPVLLLRSAP